MKCLKCFLLAALIASVISSCAVVYTTQPIGERPEELQAKEWEGTWISAEGSVLVEVLDEAKGILRVSWMESGAEGVELESHEVRVREYRSWLFANVRDQDEPEKIRYLWCRIIKESRELIFLMPDVEKFKTLVKQGKLPGRVEGDDVILADLSAQHMNVIASGAEGVLFSWEAPAALIRINDMVP